MKTIVYSLSMLLAFSLIFSSCKKYEEGPTFSLLTKKARLVNTWKIDKVLINGVEQAKESSWDNTSYEITKDGKYKITTETVLGTATTEGEWEFDDSKEHIITTFSTTAGSITISDKDTTKIVRLKNKELWTEDEDGGIVTRTQYVPK